MTIKPHPNLLKKKEREQWFFDFFAKVYPEPIELIPRDKIDPSPDFLTTIDNRTVGIELTEYNVEKVKARVAYKEKIEELAEQEYNLLLLTPHKDVKMPANGIIIFHYKHDLDRWTHNINQKEIASCIAQLLYNDSQLLLRDNQNVSRPHSKALKKYGLDKILYDITLWGDHNKVLWGNSISEFFRAGNIESEHVVERIKKIVAEKENEYPKYIIDCEECWLLIYLGGGPNSALHLENYATVEANYQSILTKSRFSKIMLLSTGGIPNILYLK
jgi:hypothetical protein